MHERSYLTHDFELAAVVFRVRIWWYYLYAFKCELFTYHCSLQHVLTQKDLNLRQRRWMDLLKDYDVTIEYHLDKADVVTHTVSQKTVSVAHGTHTQIVSVPDNDTHSNIVF